MKRARRRYRLGRRAEGQAETRRRIVRAAVGLHGSIGPLATTISAIALSAGVERETVYRHFPDERSLFRACTAHFGAAHAGPSIDAWRGIADRRRRVQRALADVYGYYAKIEPMAANILRDAEVAPDRVGSSFAAFHTAARAALLDGWNVSAGRRKQLRAAIGHALSFDTWRSLVREEGASARTAADLMTRFVLLAAHASIERPAAMR